MRQTLLALMLGVTLMPLGNGYTIVDDQGNTQGSANPNYSGGYYVQDNNGNLSTITPDYGGGYRVNDDGDTSTTSKAVREILYGDNDDNNKD